MVEREKRARKSCGKKKCRDKLREIARSDARKSAEEKWGELDRAKDVSQW